MSTVHWIGESPYWTVPPPSRDARFVMPLTEEAVLKVATMETSARRLSLQAALRCTSRLAMRVALAPTGLNPRWRPMEWEGPSVVKAPASCASSGVRFLPASEYIAALEKAAPELARFGVVEEWVEGPEYEVDGYVVGGSIGHFAPLREHWNEPRDRIVRYERATPPGDRWRDAVDAAVKAVGLDDAPFCVEMRYQTSTRAWRVIEIHARLGEDERLASLMSEEYPLQVIERACEQS